MKLFVYMKNHCLRNQKTIKEDRTKRGGRQHHYQCINCNWFLILSTPRSEPKEWVVSKKSHLTHEVVREGELVLPCIGVYKTKSVR